MAKKKKTQLKPVARGFATTSVPKKAVDPVEEEEQPNEVELQIPEQQGEPEPSAGQDGSKAADAEEFDFDKAEQHSLQTLVDQHQEKTEREILRTVKVSLILFMNILQGLSSSRPLKWTGVIPLPFLSLA